MKLYDGWESVEPGAGHAKKSVELKEALGVSEAPDKMARLEPRDQ